MLAKRLARHGLELSCGALAAVLSQNLASACVPPLVVSSTIKIVTLVAAGEAAVTGAISVKVATLTEGVLKAMLLSKLKIATAVLLAVLGMVSFTCGMLARGQTVGKDDGVEKTAAKAEDKPKAVAKDEGLAVKNDGVVFEIVLPERDWSIPENKPGSSSAFIKLGLQITNKTDKPLRFNGYDTIWPELMTPDGKEVHRWDGPQGSGRHRQPQEKDYPLVEPGKSTTLFLQTDLFWPTLEHRTLMFRWWHASGSAGRYFDDLKTGPYKVRLVYENQRKSLEVENPTHKVLDDNVWTGRVVTPSVRVSLR